MLMLLMLDEYLLITDNMLCRVLVYVYTRGYRLVLPWLTQQRLLCFSLLSHWKAVRVELWGVKTFQVKYRPGLGRPGEGWLGSLGTVKVPGGVTSVSPAANQPPSVSPAPSVVIWSCPSSHLSSHALTGRACRADRASTPDSLTVSCLEWGSEGGVIVRAECHPTPPPPPPPVLHHPPPTPATKPDICVQQDVELLWCGTRPGLSPHSVLTSQHVVQSSPGLPLMSCWPSPAQLL